MNRILEFSPSQEEAVVARVLVLVHQAVDEHFPSAEKATRQFTKTVFSDDGSEKTSAARVPGEDGPSRPAFGDDEETSPEGRAATDGQPHAVPPPPPPPPPRQTPQVAAAQSHAKHSPQSQHPSPPHTSATPLNPMNQSRTGNTKSTRLDTTIEGMQQGVGPDWVTRITVALLVAGLVLLAYVLFS